GQGVDATDDLETALRHARTCCRFVIAYYLCGPEVSLSALCIGGTVAWLQRAQPMKRAHDSAAQHDSGEKRAYTPLPWVPEGLADQVMREVVHPTIADLGRRGLPYQGVLYVGLALTAKGSKVVEFNARFGAPETQVLLDRLETPLGGLLMACATGELGLDPVFKPGAAVTVVVAAEGYPAAPVKGDVITGLEPVDGAYVLHAGTAERDG